MFASLSTSYAVLNRSGSLFAEDMARSAADLRAVLGGASVLVLGAAGSIGAAFVKQLTNYRLRALHIVDPSENNLVELVRDLRSSGIRLPDDFSTFSIGMGSPEFELFIRYHQSYQFVANFAALKHVRSERDPFTLRRMVATNALNVDSLLRALSGTAKFFCVSSDKAVRPASVMGATKALMELILLLHAERIRCSSARFANVAFSDGSLLASFVMRLGKGQPICGPSDVKRYFITEEEAGELCLLAAFLGANREFFIPRLHTSDVADFAKLAERFLSLNGKVPRWCSSEEEARSAAAGLTPKSEAWPCYFAPSDTSGEKDVEEFVAPDELVDENRFSNVGVIQRELSAAQSAQLQETLAEISSWYAQPGTSPDRSKEQLIGLLRRALKGFAHQELGRNLDQKM